MIHGLTFADHNMSISAMKCRESMLKYGLDECAIWSPSDIDDDFLLTNRDTFSQSRGAGYWLWKPYTLYWTMLAVEENDTIIYSDAGIEFTASLAPVLNTNEDIFLFGNCWKHVHWCKGDVIQRINHASLQVTQTFSGPIYTYGGYESFNQVQASVIIVKNTQRARAFIKEWLMWCQMPGLIDDSPSQAPNHPEFQEHRHDQAILCCLAIREQIKLHWFPSSTAHHLKDKYPDDHYGQLFVHHRRRNHEWK